LTQSIGLAGEVVYAPLDLFAEILNHFAALLAMGRGEI
jgi:hypothetical protein